MDNLVHIYKTWRLNFYKFKMKQCCSLLLFFAVLLRLNAASRQCYSTSPGNVICLTFWSSNPPNITDDRRLRVECRWDNSEYAFEEWRFNNNPILASTVYTISTESSSQAGVALSSLDIQGGPSVQGEYRCSVLKRNVESTMREYASATVYYYRSISFEEDLVLPTVPTMMNVGERLTFSCTVTNHHAMQWEKPGKVEVTNSSDGRVTVGGNGALTFTHLTHEDTSKYFCFAYIYSTPTNRETLQAANIFRPVVVKGKPSISCDEQVKSVTPGSTVSLRCVVRAYPTPKINWVNPPQAQDHIDITNKSVSNTFYPDYTNTWNAELSFREYVQVRDSGIYRLEADNEYGMAALNITLTVLNSPDVLAAPVLSLVNATTVQIMWSPPANADRETLNILYYMVLYGVVDSGDPRIQVNASSEQLSLNVILLPDTKYYFAVGAVSQVNTGEAGLSPQSRISTERSVPSQPQNVLVQSVTPQTAEISWDQLTGARTGASVGVLQSYVVAYKEAGEPWDAAKQVTVPPSTSSVVLDDLRYNSSYVVSVKGVNDLGEGQPGYSRLFRTLPLIPPGSPLGVHTVQLGSNQVRLCWTDGPDTYHVHRYRVTIYLSNETHYFNESRQVNVEGTRMDGQQCAQVYGLQANNCYRFSLSASNVAGSSGESDMSTTACTTAHVTSGLEAFTEPHVLVPFVISMVTVVIIAAIIVLICVIRRSNRAKQIYITNSRKYSGRDSRSNGSTCSHSNRFHRKEPHAGSTTGHVGGGPIAVHSSLDNPSPSGWGTFSITADSGIPDLPILEEEQVGPAAKFPHHPTTRSTQEDSEFHTPLQWTLGPAHESREAPPVIDRFVSVDPSDSGYDFSEEHSVNHHGNSDENEEFDYTDNVAYGKVSLMSPGKKNAITLVVDPKTPEKELVIFHSKRTTSTSNGNLQTNL